MTRNSRGEGRQPALPVKLLRQALEHFPQIVYLRDLLERRFVYVNRPFQDIFVFSQLGTSAVANDAPNNALHPADRKTVEQTLQKLATAANDEIVETVYRLRGDDGQWHWVRMRNVVISRLADDTPRFVVGTITDNVLPPDEYEEERELRQQVEPDQRRLRQLLELSERERRLVAYDVHDGFVQDVVSAQLGIDAMLDHLAASDPESVPPLLRVRAFVRKAIDEARRVVSELRPAITDDGGLVEAIQFLVNEAEVAHQMDVKFDPPESFPSLSPLLVRSLVRIVQEAVNNIRRHAKTSEATIRLRQVARDIHLEITDHGKGFDPTAVPAGRFGLEGMQERARVFNGQSTIVSSPGNGTRISVVVPLESPSPDTPVSQARPAKRKGPSVKRKSRRKK